MKFLATEYRDGGEYARTLDASDWKQAEYICKQRGWTLDGELMAMVPFEQTCVAEMDDMIERRNENRYDA